MKGSEGQGGGDEHPEARASRRKSSSASCARLKPCCELGLSGVASSAVKAATARSTSRRAERGDAGLVSVHIRSSRSTRGSAILRIVEKS